ncbi:hypothetical protein DK59_3113 [Brucella abortus bv. 4 str. 292]|nr:hypothetical protein DK59_3113 [Brucella abortus bv. 4 str. 292]
MAFNDIFFDFTVENAVNRTKNLHLVETTAAIGNQIFQNAALTARERKIDTVDLRIAAIGENTDRPQLRAICARGCRCARTAADRIDARENFADMNGLAHHIVNPGLKKLKCMLKRRTVVDGDNRRLAAFTNAGREAMLVGAFTNQEGFNRHNILFRNTLDPFIEIGRCETCCRDPFATEPGRISFSHHVSVVNDNNHRPRLPNQYVSPSTQEIEG